MSQNISTCYGLAQAAFNREFHDQLDKGTDPAWAQDRTWKAQGKAEKAAKAPDESRLKGRLKIESNAGKQTRGGQYADADSIYRQIETVQALHDAASTAAHRERIEAAVALLPGKGEANAKSRENRKMRLRTWRKSLRVIIRDINADRYDFVARQYAEELMKIETEPAYPEEPWKGTMYFQNVESILPRYVQRVGRDAIMDRFKALYARYFDAYRDAALASIETGEFKAPSLIDGRDIGVRFHLTDERLKRLFPKGHHGIRACDRDQINADKEARGLKVRQPYKRKTREEIAQAAAEQRDVEELMAYFGYTRETVMKWRSSKPKPGSDVYGEKFWDMLELMENQKAKGIDPKRKADVQLTPELSRALQLHFDVTDAAVRKWKSRKKLAEKVAEYRRATALTVVA